MDTDQDRVQYEFGSACDVGRKRRGKPNEDAMEVVVPSSAELWHPPLLLVADGLGKHFGGAVASRLTVQTFKQEFKASPHPAEYLPLLERCVRAAHQAVRAEGVKDPKLAFMGSTIVAATMTRGRLFVLNVGDSRAYIFRDKNIRLVSQDQSWVAAQLRAGVLTEQEARTHPNRNRLMMAITAKRSEIRPYVAEEKLEPQDILLLCSDGLWGVVPETLILAAATELQPQVAADKLVALANNSRGPDNISVIVARRGNITRTTANVEDTDS